MENEAMEWARIARSFFWPGAVIILFLILFHGPIYEFLKDLGELNFGGASAKRRLPDQSEPPTPPPGELPSESPTSGTPPADTTDETEKLRILAYYWFYEKMYRLLFGTQTQALGHVSTRPAGADRPEIEKFYMEHERRVKEAKIDHVANWNTWISFMTDSGLMRAEGDLYHINPLGTAFLQWMSAEHLGDNNLL